MNIDRHTGDVVWLYDCDDNREGRERVAAEPERYLEIPGRDHGEHHEILLQFLRSDWTDNDACKQRAAEAYFGSIGEWKRDVRDEEVVHAFRAFRKAEVAKRAKELM